MQWVGAYVLWLRQERISTWKQHGDRKQWRGEKGRSIKWGGTRRNNWTISQKKLGFPKWAGVFPRYGVREQRIKMPT